MTLLSDKVCSGLGSLTCWSETTMGPSPPTDIIDDPLLQREVGTVYIRCLNLIVIHCTHISNDLLTQRRASFRFSYCSTQHWKNVQYLIPNRMVPLVHCDGMRTYPMSYNYH